MRDPDADEAHAVRFVRELCDEVVAYLGEHLLVHDVGRERPFPQMGLESLETDFDADRPEGGPLRSRAEIDVVRDVSVGILDAVPLHDVPIERPLDAD